MEIRRCPTRQGAHLTHKSWHVVLAKFSGLERTAWQMIGAIINLSLVVALLKNPLGSEEILVTPRGNRRYEIAGQINIEKNCYVPAKFVFVPRNC